MIYKTLHWYILRELLRVFFMTAGALTTLLAFGGTFKPLTKEGLEIGQLMVVLTNLMPAMLAYAIPLAALFAAVLVYWRLSTDNEIVACRAGGVSFLAIVFPALVLGLVVASADLVFVNYVVPAFLQRTERSVRKDIGSVLVHNVGKQEYFQYDRLVVYADGGTQYKFRPGEPALAGAAAVAVPPDVAERTVVVLNGMAASILGKDKRPSAMVVAKRANVIIDEVRDKDEVRVLVQLDEGAGFDPNTFRKISGTVQYLPPDGTPFVIPSQLKNKPKFLNWPQLRELDRNPMQFSANADRLDAIRDRWRYQEVSAQLFAAWKRAPAQPLRFDQGAGEETCIIAPQASLNAERQLVFARSAAAPIRVEQYRNKRLIYAFHCGAADLTLAGDDYLAVPGEPPPVVGSLRIRENISRFDLQRPGANHEMVTREESVLVQPLRVPAAFVAAARPLPEEELRAGTLDLTPELRTLSDELKRKVASLLQIIGSELNSRGSFALSCLTLVLLGAALGILLRGHNPLMVFVVGFVPALILVLLITAGRRVVEGASPGSSSISVGYSIIWAGNALLVVILAAVYGKLLRQ